mmetsp:Transcript_42474/g.84437  ORF Transcript_42474/g.84437 Transcript_42474/m.84437 type:complete len:204 (+) Transcript_42474:1031-1642(+)
MCPHAGHRGRDRRASTQIRDEAHAPEAEHRERAVPAGTLPDRRDLETSIGAGARGCLCLRPNPDIEAEEHGRCQHGLLPKAFVFAAERPSGSARAAARQGHRRFRHLLAGSCPRRHGAKCFRRIRGGARRDSRHTTRRGRRGARHAAQLPVRIRQPRASRDRRQERRRCGCQARPGDLAQAKSFLGLAWKTEGDQLIVGPGLR